VKLEILLQGSLPKIYSINKNTIIIGSSASVDICLSHDEISKNHLCIFQEGEKFYAKDLDSQNGTFLNHERLDSQQIVEITSSTPLVLSRDVLVSLIPDDEVLDKNILEEVKVVKDTKVDSDITRIISINDLSKSKSVDPVKKRLELRKKNRSFYQNKTFKDDKGRLFKALTFLFILTMGLYFLNKKSRKQSESLEDSSRSSVRPLVDEDRNATAEANKFLIPGLNLKKLDQNKIPPYHVFMENLVKKKCKTEFEKKLCSLFPETNKKFSGVLVENQSVFIYLHRGARLLEAESYFPKEDKTSTPNDSFVIEDTSKVELMFLLLLKNHPQLNWADYKSFDFYYIFYVGSPDPFIDSVAGLVSSNAPLIKNELTQEFFNKVKRHGKEVYQQISQYLIFFKPGNIPAEFQANF
jgi:pSer/pThr/pTyr-binding forkhead associated (FHA) protein